MPETVTAPGTPRAHHPPRNNIKETLISLIIAFALAFVFRGFVVEAFLIPTGSMAPTLNGQHVQFTNPRTGLSWAVGPRQQDMLTPDTPKPFEGSERDPIRIVDPMSRLEVGAASGVRTRAGDRIFVMKYLYSIFDPARFDIVVFKNPTEPQVNFIKRLIGLPGDQLALIDGDVWVRTPQPDDPKEINPWQLPGWRVAVKPELAQRSAWQPVFDSQYAPIGTVNGRLFDGPWRVPAEGNAQWDVAGKQDYRFDPKGGKDSTYLLWDYNTPIRDYYAYNEGGLGIANGRYNVGDMALSMGVRPDADGLNLGLVVQAYRHEFKAEFSGTKVALKMRVAPGDASSNSSTDPGWTTLTTATIAAPFRAGMVTDVEFWHADQTLCAFVNGKEVARASYDWTPHQRIVNATTLGEDWAAALRGDPSLLIDPSRYVASGARLEFAGGAFTISRVALQRDLFYQPATYSQEKMVGGIRMPNNHAGQPALATAPTSVLTLGPDEFFCCGDNSPASLDGRLWDDPDPWVGQIDPKAGIVPRDLLIGRAFFVYFPAPSWRGMIPIPDFGRMRFIW